MLRRSVSAHLHASRLVLAWVGIGLAATTHLPPSPAQDQLQTLSAGNADEQWRQAQLQAFEGQLADDKLPEELKRELTAQRTWLGKWEPKSRPGNATDNVTDNVTDNATDKDTDKQQDQEHGEPVGNADDGDASNSEGKEVKAEKTDGEKGGTLREPIVDPEDRAEKLRSRLFDPKRKATVADTQALQTALSENSGDVGLRQLQLHWIDQPTYRDAHWQEIASAADRVLALLSDLPATDETKAAAAFTNYRKARALGHALRGRPLRGGKIAGVDKLSDVEREQMQIAIGECWRQIETLVGAGHREFFQLELYNLRRYGWNGQALELLERHASAIDKISYLQERQSILQTLGWKGPAEQTAAALGKAKEQAVDEARDEARGLAFEIQFVPPTPAATN